jgi:hypothetical protein
MKVADLLRKLADVIAAAEGDESEASPMQTNKPELMQVDVPNDDESESGVFVPPLQAKLELLKKSVNVDNIYDQGGEDSDLTGHGDDNEDELDRVKKLSGINITAQHEAADDEPFDG